MFSNIVKITTFHTLRVSHRVLIGGKLLNNDFAILLPLNLLMFECFSSYKEKVIKCTDSSQLLINVDHFMYTAHFMLVIVHKELPTCRNRIRSAFARAMHFMFTV